MHKRPRPFYVGVGSISALCFVLVILTLGQIAPRIFAGCGESCGDCFISFARRRRAIQQPRTVAQQSV
jgi:hypothetical protein